MYEFFVVDENNKEIRVGVCEWGTYEEDARKMFKRLKEQYGCTIFVRHTHYLRWDFDIPNKSESR